MNWKILGKALLVTTGFVCILALILVLGHYCPIALGIIAYIGLVAIVYGAMEKDSYEGNDDIDRMSWNSDNYEDEEDEQ